ncbi:MAG: radical SAM protein [Slackia sp.]|nr:radical SAM protein [Slackia sp.]
MFEEELAHCALCPRRCGANRAAGERGVCGATDALRIARAALHFWEEPPVSGDAGSGTVFFSHCPLHCLYCQNAPIANGCIGADVSVERLAKIFLELQEQGALNANLVTATHYAPHVLAALRLARAAGFSLPVVWNTSGYETVETVQRIAPYVDTFLTDLRYARAATAKAYSHAADYPCVARAALAAMTRTDASVIVRILALPGHLDEAKENVRFVHETYGERVMLSMMSQYTPPDSCAHHPLLGRTISPEEYEELLDFADGIGCEEYFWQDGDAAQESFIPDFFSLEGVRGNELH